MKLYWRIKKDDGKWTWIAATADWEGYIDCDYVTVDKLPGMEGYEDPAVEEE